MFILIDPDLNQAPMQLKQLLIETELENWRIRTKQEAMMTENCWHSSVAFFGEELQRRYHQHGSNKGSQLINFTGSSVFPTNLF